jgi:molybdenum cofactor sulfurtransferase
VTDLADAASPAAVDPDWDGAAVEELRAREYARLDARGETYLDYTGGGLYAESQLRAHHELLRTGIFGNPHSSNPTSLAATAHVEGARRAVLAFLNASPEQYTVAFTANATGALKLVGEAYPFAPGSRYLIGADNHNSVQGIRELARARGAEIRYLPLRQDLRFDGAVVLDALDHPPARGPNLFAYPAQSNYSGVRHPRDWIEHARERGWDTLLDAAAFVPASRLDLTRWRPDFVAISWYKVFGYPTGIGSLVVRRDTLARLARPWFAGGTIAVASVAEPRHTMAPGEAAFEDGTLDYLGLPAIEIGLRHIESVGIDTIHRRVGALVRMLIPRMAALRHRNGAPLIRLDGPTDDVDRGGTVAFNVLDRTGAVVDDTRIEALAADRRISLRTGCFCNPGASEAARGLTADEMRRLLAFDHHPSPAEVRGVLPGRSVGAVRASVGIATTDGDIDRLIDFLGSLTDIVQPA